MHLLSKLLLLFLGIFNQTPLQCRESHYSSKRVSSQEQKELHPLDNRVEQGVKDAKKLIPAL